MRSFRQRSRDAVPTADQPEDRAPRRWLWRVVRWSAAATLALALVAATAGGWYYYRVTRGALPQTSGRIALAGLAGDVDVLRDAWGTPHVAARQSSDLYFTQGYVTAQDRLWQMDLLRRGAAGELSEIVGERAFAADRGQRTLGYRAVAQRSYEALDPEVRASLDDYTRGVNAYIAEQGDTLPFEFQVLRYAPKPWTPVDSLMIGKLLAQTLGTTWQRDLMRSHFSDLDPETYADLFAETSPYDVPFVGADLPKPPAVKAPGTNDSKTPAKPTRRTPSKKPAVPPGERLPSFGPRAAGTSAAGVPTAASAKGDVALANPNAEDDPAASADWVIAMLEPAGDVAPKGSNNWVVGGDLTATGSPLLANDPHLSLDIPPIWYAAHLRLLDGSVNVAGVTFPGIPGVVIGHTSEVAWGVTNFNPDAQDLYAEEFDANGSRYKVGDEWRDAEVRAEKIVVRTDPLRTETETRTVNVLVTRHGPIVSDQGATKYALRWTALDPVSEMTAFYFLDRARDWDSFRKALATFPGPMQNFVYADRTGNIGYYAAGLVPLRSSGDGSVPVPGAGDEGTWKGYVAFDDLPHAFNPPDRFVVTANNRVLGTSTPQFYTHEWMAPFRALRITELLRSKAGLSSDDMSAIQADVYSYPDAIFAREAVKAAEARVAAGDSAPEWKRMADRLEDWDGRLTTDSTAAALAVSMRKVFNERVLTAKLGGRYGAYSWFNREVTLARIVESRPANWLPQGTASWDALFLYAYREAVRSLGAQLGDDQAEWRYGRLNAFQFTHPLGQVPGLASVLNPAGFEMDGGPQTVKAIMGSLGMTDRKWGSSMRIVDDLADFDRSTLNLPTGQSGQHASSHYADQIDDWRFVRPHPFPFSDAAVRAAATETLLLTPDSPRP